MERPAALLAAMDELDAVLGCWDLLNVTCGTASAWVNTGDLLNRMNNAGTGGSEAGDGKVEMGYLVGDWYAGPVEPLQRKKRDWKRTFPSWASINEQARDAVLKQVDAMSTPAALAAQSSSRPLHCKASQESFSGADDGFRADPTARRPASRRYRRPSVRLTELPAALMTTICKRRGTRRGHSAKNGSTADPNNAWQSGANSLGEVPRLWCGGRWICGAATEVAEACSTAGL